MMKHFLFDFTDQAAMTGWEGVDDVVMGGRSAGTILWLESGCLCFRGVVSLENGGGFSSIRSPIRDYNLGGTAGIGLRVRGDGWEYKLNLRTDEALDGIAYQVPFRTVAGGWQELFFSYDRFTPTYHGRVLRDEPPLDPARVKRIGFIIAGRQAGEFQLDIACIWTSPPEKG